MSVLGGLLLSRFKYREPYLFPVVKETNVGRLQNTPAFGFTNLHYHMEIKA
jgi:hypothetical protein